MFETAALKSKDLQLEARCCYNLGNTLFRQAQRQMDSDLKKALTAYQDAVKHYRDALKRDSDLRDAAHNIEITRLIIKDILDKIKKKEEEQKKQQEYSSCCLSPEQLGRPVCCINFISFRLFSSGAV